MPFCRRTLGVGEGAVRELFAGSEGTFRSMRVGRMET